MFGLFKNKNKHLRLLDDKIWLTRARYYEGIFKDAQELAQSGRLVLITNFFPNTCEELAFVLKNAGLEFTSVSNLGDIALATGGIYLASVDSVLAFKQIGSLQNMPTSILVAGHYPIPSKQEVLEAHLKTAQSEVIELAYYNSMDSKIFQLFGGDRIIETMKRMGMKTDEQITHSMISKSIKKAQLKLAQSVRQERTALSEEDWFELNIKK